MNRSGNKKKYFHSLFHKYDTRDKWSTILITMHPFCEITKVKQSIKVLLRKVTANLSKTVDIIESDIIFIIHINMWIVAHYLEMKNMSTLQLIL